MALLMTGNFISAPQKFSAYNFGYGFSGRFSGKLYF